MRKSIQLILAVFAAGILVVAAIKTSGAHDAKKTSGPKPQASEEISVVRASYAFEEHTPPARLVIPSLNIDAAIQAVGIAADGSMDVAHSYREVGWYKYGIIPGALGSAVIEGHLDTKISPYAVFHNLGKLKPGDVVKVIDAAGKTLQFAVTGSKKYPYNTTTTEVFGAAAQTAETSNLNLVTCAGTWLKDKKIYDERLVVFTKRVR